MNGKILISGCAGMIGSHLQDELTRQGYKVIGVDNLSWGYRRNVLETTKFYECDLRSAKMIDFIMEDEKPDYVIACAADATENRSQFTPISATENNFQASINTFTAAIKHGVKKIVFLSSIAVYGDQTPPFTELMDPNPIDIYAVNKRATEEALKILCDVHNVDWIIFRPYNVFGEKQNISDAYRNVIGIFMNRIMQGKPPLIYGDGEQERAFSYIGNIVPPMIRAMTMNLSGETFNIGPERPVTVNKLAEMVLQCMGSDLTPEHLPARLHEVKRAYCDVSKARELLGYRDKYSIEEGLEIMAKWAKELGPQPFKYFDTLEINKNAPEAWRKKTI